MKLEDFLNSIPPIHVQLRNIYWQHSIELIPESGKTIMNQSFQKLRPLNDLHQELGTIQNIIFGTITQMTTSVKAIGQDTVLEDQIKTNLISIHTLLTALNHSIPEH